MYSTPKNLLNHVTAEQADAIKSVEKHQISLLGTVVDKGRVLHLSHLTSVVSNSNEWAVAPELCRSIAQGLAQKHDFIIRGPFINRSDVPYQSLEEAVAYYCTDESDPAAVMQCVDRHVAANPVIMKRAIYNARQSASPPEKTP